MGKMIEIRWHGRGGQGVVTAGKLLADAALDTGQYFQAFPDYGPERMGAPIRAFTRLSDTPIEIYSQIDKPDVVIVMDPSVMSKIDVAEGVKDGGKMIVNSPQSPAEIRQQLDLEGNDAIQVYTVDASHIAIEELGREITNTPMLGAFAQATGFFELDSLETQIRHKFERKLSEKLVNANVRAMRRAAEQVQEG
jgi:pyruvate ferredoxin oxidoreductase gamma subunit